MLMRLLSSTSSFKHWTSPFKETLMAFIHTNKTRHIWHLEMTILLVLKFITPSITVLKAYFFFLVVKQWMCRKKTGGKTWKCNKIDAFLSFTLYFCPLSIPHHVFLIAPFVFNKHRVLTPIFLNFIENSIDTKT
jgi:hypothetical protein